MKTMKIKLFIIGFLLIGASSCSNEELPVYEDVNRIYFSWVADFEADYKEIKLGYDDPVKTDSLIKIKVHVAGRASDADRPITAEVVGSESTAITGTDIEIVPSIVPAGDTRGELIVRIKNTERLNKATLRARIRLTPNEFFHTDLNEDGRLEFNLYFDAIADIPNLWAMVDAATITLGPWSRTRELLIYELFGITREFFTYDPATEDPTTVWNQRVPGNLGYAMTGQINRYLRDYELKHGEPLKDENGNVVTMPRSGTIM